MNVKEIVDAIIRECKTPPLEETCDLLITGDWENEVTGIATTFMATVDVIREAIANDANLIITHEPTFFTHSDKTDWLEQDPVYLEKMRLIQEHAVNIWRFHDHMHMTDPDLIYVGLIKELGWEQYLDSIDKHCFTLPRTSVRELSDFLKRKLEVKISQIVGDIEGSAERVAVLVGGGSLGLGRDEMPMELMRDRNLDVIVCGEILEWTLTSYVRDAAQLGMNKALIVLGHNRTEEVGMKYLPEWLQKIFPTLPISFVEAGEPFEYI
ncbi:MAG: Nif3-like dinuclear metal center hexameric protein [Anaerolineales bacterium]|nr:Nif3-like dinuclear metal center hexameric protein [Anaerolineales bacterium]